MSGEAVLIPAATVLAPATLGATAMVAAAIMVNELLKQRRQQALEKMRAKKEQISSWVQYEAQQKSSMSDFAVQHEHLRQNLQQLQLLTLAAPQPTQENRNTQVQADSYMQVPETLAQRQQQQAFVRQLQQQLDAAPNALKTGDDAPVPRLAQQLQNLLDNIEAGQFSAEAQLVSWQKTIERTLEAYLQDLDTKSKQQQTRYETCKTLLEEIITYQSLARDAQQQKVLATLQQQLLKLIESDDITQGNLELISNKFSALQTSIDQYQRHLATHTALQQRMTHHLSHLGYQCLDNPDATATNSVWAIPGGEQVQIRIHDNFQIAFQLRHERNSTSRAPLSTMEQAFLKQQEKKWCDDLHNLLRELVKDGFAYQLQFERDSAVETIPIVVVESADEIAAAARARRAENQGQNYLDS